MRFRTVGLVLATVAVAVLGGILLRPSDHFFERDLIEHGLPALQRGEAGLVDGVVARERQQATTADYRLSGPYVHENLTVYLVHGPEKLDGSFLTLSEALEQKKAVVHETDAVDELTIENLSDREIYVQSGDVVKGGKQDRVLRYDVVIRPRSVRVPVAAFCVEQGRWAGRGEEPAREFAQSPSNVGNVVAMRRSLAAREGSQEEVWRNVERTQERLGRKVGGSVRSDASASSLQLSLENNAVRDAIAKYLEDLLGTSEVGNVVRVGFGGGLFTRRQEREKGDAIGLVVAVNGRVISADVYGSRELFRKMLPRLLEGCAIEALMASEAKGDSADVSEKDVWAFLGDAEAATPSREATNERTDVDTRQGKVTTVQESSDRSRNNVVLHRSFVLR